MTFEIDRIDHLVLNCTDPDATADWYRRALGVRTEPYGEGRTAIVFGRQKINLRPVGATGWETAREDVPGSLAICFETSSPIAHVLAHWSVEDIPVHEGPVARTGAHGPMTSVYAVDPDGNLVEVAHYRKDA